MLGNVAFVEYEWFDFHTHRSRAGALKAQLAEQRLCGHSTTLCLDRFHNGTPNVHAVLPTPPECPKTCAYIERRTAEGKTKKENIRCLKRRIAL